MVPYKMSTSKLFYCAVNFYSFSYVTSTFVIEAMAAANAYTRIKARNSQIGNEKITTSEEHGSKEHGDQFQPPAVNSEKESLLDDSVPQQWNYYVSVFNINHSFIFVRFLRNYIHIVY